MKLIFHPLVIWIVFNFVIINTDTNNLWQIVLKLIAVKLKAKSNNKVNLLNYIKILNKVRTKKINKIKDLL